MSENDITVPLVPSGFNFTVLSYTLRSVVITFQWEPPQGGGPQTVVDYYLLSVSPRPLSQPITANVSGTLVFWNVTLEYNTSYSANITAVNCAGNSGTAVIEAIEFSK